MTLEEFIRKTGKLCTEYTKNGSCRACGTNRRVYCAFERLKLLNTMGVEKSAEEGEHDRNSCDGGGPDDHGGN